MDQISSDFFEKLHLGWRQHMETLLNTTIPGIRLNGDDIVEDLKKIVNLNKDLTLTLS
jgi:hypothetical protein